MDNPLASICCITYNHEPYIRQCIDGLLMQKTTFPFEILIHDDASTDNTANIIREYEAKYPDIIKPIYQTENQYSKGIKISITYNFPRVKGKYIAICEGDDSWIDNLKLQKQIDFLENNIEYGLVHTNFRINNIPKKVTFINNIKLSSGDSFDHYLLGKFHIASLTVCFRSIYLETIDYSYINENFSIGDYPIWVQIFHKSKIKFLPDVTANYNILDESASHSKDVKKQIKYQIDIRDVRLFFAYKFNKSYLINHIECEQYYYYSLLFYMQKKYIKSFLYLVKSRNPIKFFNWCTFIMSKIKQS